MIALLIVLALLLLLMLTRISIDFSYLENRLSLLLRIGLVPIRILPRTKKTVRTESKKKSAKTDKPKKKREKPTLQFILEIAKMLLHALERFRKGVYVDNFHLRFISGSNDPYNTAMLCGYANAAVGMLAPIARRAFRIRESNVEIGTDFDADKPQFSGRLKVTLRVWHVPHIALAFAFEFLRYKRSSAKQSKDKNTKEKDNSQANTRQDAVPAGT